MTPYDPSSLDEAQRLLESARADGRDALLEHEVYALLLLAGFDVPAHVFWRGEPLPGTLAAGTLPATGEVVLKIASPQLLHKADAGGVAFVTGDPERVAEAARSLWETVGRRAPGVTRLGVLAVERLRPRPCGPATEALVALKDDPAFGPVLVLGLGGALTEWFGELAEGRTAVALQPGDVRAGLVRVSEQRPGLASFFRSGRHSPEPPLDLDTTAALLERLGALGIGLRDRSRDAAGATPALAELEVNPLLCTADGRWVAVDGKARLAPATAAGGRRPLRKIHNLLEPRSAVVLGASANAVNPGRIILRNLKAAAGLRYGQLRVVHPRAPEIDGVPCLPSLGALPEPVDLAVVALPARQARDAVVELCRSGGAESIILIPGGFAETGHEALAQDIVGALAASRATPGEGPVLVGGNCLGIVSKRRYNTFFLPHYKLPFHDAPGDELVAISQSGAYLVSLGSNLDGVVFPRASISFGNQMDLTAADLLEHFRDDDGVKVVACYLEGFRPGDGERFLSAARALRRRGRRLLVFKAGRTALAAQAVRSHTAALAGDYAVARDLLEGAGAIVAQTLDMLEDYTKVFSMLFARIPRRSQVGILSNAGFECAAVLDRLYGLVPARLAAETRRRLAEGLPEVAHADNPVDATPTATTSQFVAAAEALIADKEVDALLLSPLPATPALEDLPPDLAGVHNENIFAPGSLPQELLRVFRATDKPIVVSVDSGRLYDDFVSMLQRGGIPVYRKIDRASRALSALCTL
jgi:acyl-CoA synthetase (NDP forming)